MKLPTIPAALLVLFLVGSAPPRATAGPVQERPEIFALMVGIDDYTYVEPKLTGCVSDVQDMQKVLHERFRFPTDKTHMLTLLNVEATRENILKQFREHLIANAKNEHDRGRDHTIILFDYSGHGSLAPDPTGTRPGGMDATMVPVDSGRKGDESDEDILGAEINDLFQELSQYTDSATFILDCCHSEAGTRDVLDKKLVAREVNPDARDSGIRQLLAREQSARERSRELKMVPTRAPGEALIALPPAGDRYVTIAGCRWNEVSYETERGGHPNGALTFHLCRELTPGISYLDLMKRVKAGVTGENESQHPEVEGDIHRPVFGMAADREDHFLEIQPAADDKHLTLRAGKAQGIQPNTLVAMYGPGAHHLTDENEKIGTAMVTKVDNFNAEMEASFTKPLPAGAKAGLVAPNFGPHPLRVTLEATGAGAAAIGAATAGTLRERLGRSKVSTLAENATRDTGGEDWDLAVLSGTFKDAFGVKKRDPARSRDAALPAEKETVYYIAGKDGVPLYGFWVRPNDSNAAVKIIAALEHAARQKHVRGLENREATLTGLSVRVIPAKVERGPDGKLRAEEMTSRDLTTTGSYPSDQHEYFRLELKNDSGKDLYVTLMDVSTDGSIGQVYPPEGASAKLGSGKSVKTALYRTTGPAGDETFKLIATTEPADFSFLAQDAVSRDPLGARTPAEQLAFLAWGIPRSELATEISEPEAWTTADLSFAISSIVK